MDGAAADLVSIYWQVRRIRNLDRAIDGITKEAWDLAAATRRSKGNIVIPPMTSLVYVGVRFY